MSATEKLAQNAFYLTLATIAQKVIAFVYFTIIARFAGIEDTGAYFLSLAIVTMLAVLDDLGVTSVLIRDVAKRPIDAKLWSQTVIGIKLFTMPITILLACLVPVWLGYDAQIVMLIRIAIGIMLADTLSLSFYGVLRGLQALSYESLGIFIGQLITSLVGVALIWSGHATLSMLIVALVVGSSWNLLFSATQVIRRLGWGALRPSWQQGWQPLKLALPFFLAAMFVKVYSYVDSLILTHYYDQVAVGTYAVAYKLTYAFQFLPLAFVAALYPSMSAHSSEPAELKKIFLKSLWYLTLLGAPIVFGLWSLAPEIIAAFYGDTYSGSVLPLQFLVFVLLFIFLDYPLGSLLNATNRQTTKTTIMGITMVINIIANLILIPRMGVLGACISALICFSFMFGAGWFAVHRVINLKFSELWSEIGRLLLSALLMAGVVILVKPYLHFVLVIPLGGIVYLSAAFASGTLTLDHVRGFLRLLRPKKIYDEENLVANG
jgi:O-antigen/teichoic acid export membrane protein